MNARAGVNPIVVLRNWDATAHLVRTATIADGHLRSERYSGNRGSCRNLLFPTGSLHLFHDLFRIEARKQRAAATYRLAHQVFAPTELTYPHTGNFSVEAQLLPQRLRGLWN